MCVSVFVFKCGCVCGCVCVFVDFFLMLKDPNFVKIAKSVNHLFVLLQRSIFLFDMKGHQGYLRSSKVINHFQRSRLVKVIIYIILNFIQGHSIHSNVIDHKSQ